ncbi:helix-turn-helix transcriptional regulator [Streptomyces sp. NPDC050619]|uniref:helix-turn-helix domain-containing protein n=1 Tax=Streptomyces sp. NPDC050619 TaxID=3157214 RepID=UPI00344AD3D1
MPTHPSKMLPQRLNSLFETMHPHGRGPFSNEEVARAIRDQGGDISKQYIAYLRKGERGNPRIHHLDALARFFGVPVSYFFDEDPATLTGRSPDAWHATGPTGPDPKSPERAGVTSVAMRAVGLSPKGMEFAKALLDQIRAMEGLSPGADRTAVARELSVNESTG